MNNDHTFTFPLALGLAPDLRIRRPVPPAWVSAEVANLTLDQARTIALKAVPGGRVLSEELSRADDGHRGALQFSFRILRGRHALEIRVDAMTGMRKGG